VRLFLPTLAPAGAAGAAAGAAGKKEEEEEEELELDKSADELDETARDTPLLTWELTRPAAFRRLSPAVAAYCCSDDPL